MLAGCGDANLSSEGEGASEVVDSDSAPDEAATPEPEEPVTEEEDTQDADVESEPAEAVEAEPERADVEIADSGFSTYTAYDDSTRASWAVVLTNPNSDHWLAASIDVTVTMLDDAGAVLASESDSLAVLLPGQSGAVTGSPFEDLEGLADIRVQARVRNWERQEGPFGSFDTSGVSVREAQFGGWTVTGEVASTFTDDFDDVYGVAVFRDVDDAIVGGAFTFIDFVPGEGDTSFQIDAYDELTGVDNAEVYVSLSSLSLW